MTVINFIVDNIEIFQGVRSLDPFQKRSFRWRKSMLIKLFDRLFFLVFPCMCSCFFSMSFVHANHNDHILLDFDQSQLYDDN